MRSLNANQYGLLLLWLTIIAASAAAQDTATPGRFLYDPKTGVSTADEHASSDAVVVAPNAVASTRSFTIEAFADPADDLQLNGGQAMPVIRAVGGGASLWAGVSRGSTYNWWSAEFRDSKTSKPITLQKRRYRGLGMVSDDTPWRHIAVVWDGDQKSLSFYVDYQVQVTRQFNSDEAWDLQSITFGDNGGSRNSIGFAGRIDNTRLSRSALNPWEFLRSTDVELTNVSFAPEAEPALPADYGHIDVRLHYGAVGDGIHDDTAAIQRAFLENDNRVPIEYQTVYFPAGTYRISDSIRFDRFMVVRGAGRDKTIIQLADNAAGYDNPDVPKPAFAVGYDWPYVNRPRKNRAGNAIGSYVFDLTIDTGKDNLAALGLDYHSNNHGTVENVSIRSGDGMGLVGLDLKRGWPGPCLMKNVLIDGFDIGIDAAHREYSLVFSGIELRNQREVAIRNRGNTLSMENVTSVNDVPAIESNGGGLIVLLNSSLVGGANTNTNTAVRSENASLYLRNVSIEGYGQSLVDIRTPKDGPTETLGQSSDQKIVEYFSGPQDSAFPTEESGSLKLQVKQTPSIDRPPLSQWVNVLDYDGVVQNNDWAPAIQAAIDSGKQVVYFPEGHRYQIKQDVVIRGRVHTLFGGSPKSRVANGWEEKKNTEELNEGPSFRLAPSVDRLQIDMLNIDRLVHDSSATLVLCHGRVSQLDGGPGCGDIFAENVGGKWRLNEHQRLWGRQLNPETKGIPELINRGGQFWVLGMKTEYLSTKIASYAGAKTELLGGLMYPVHPVKDESLPMFINENSDLSLIHAVSSYQKNHKIYIRDTQAGQTVDHATWHWVGGRSLINVYRSESR